jgi:hypothetical protein
MISRYQMTRILADLPDDDIAWLDRLADERGKSRAAVLREAVSAYKSHASNAGKKDWIERGAGYWRDRPGFGDAVEYQRAMREDRSSFGDA